jgi:hypothetical protein
LNTALWFLLLLSLFAVSARREVADQRRLLLLERKVAFLFRRTGADPAGLEAEFAQAEEAERSTRLRLEWPGLMSGYVGALIGTAAGAVAGHYQVGGLPDLVFGALAGAAFGFAAGAILRGFWEEIRRAKPGAPPDRGRQSGSS